MQDNRSADDVNPRTIADVDREQGQEMIEALGPIFDPDWDEFCADYNARQRARQIAAGSPLADKLRAIAERYLDDLDDDLKGLGEHIWTLADEADALEAKSWGQYLDRRDAMLDSRM